MEGIYRVFDVQIFQKSHDGTRQILVAAIEKFQSSFDECSIFSDERHDIRNRSDGHDRQKIIENLILLVLVQLRFRQECTDQLKGYSDSRQSLERIVRRNLRIHYRDSFRDSLQILVMVGDDEIDSLFFCIDRFCERGDAIIYRDNEIHVLGFHLVDVDFLQTISFIHSIGILDADILVVEIFGDKLIYDIT